MNTQLTNLMQQATENLEPVTPDLLERSVAQGLRQRRRRTTLLTATGAGAVLATAGLIAGGIHLLGSPADAAAAGTPVPLTKPSASIKPSAKTPPANAGQVTPKQTLATLRTLLEASHLSLSKSETWGGGDFVGAAYVANDGKGAARVDVMISGGGEGNPCVPVRQGCTTLSDGSVLFTSKNNPEYSDGRQAQYGVVSNYVVLFRRDGRNINLTSYNAPAEKGQQHTRPKPILSVDELTTLAKSKAWKLPPVSAAKPTTK
ncbi:hypothetical protein [Kribbella kalugense]|uniref:Uncharacterized protein n=1 Tax=Kribbella kalugense TaxID=2512221 RepID=A0A4R8A1Q1_9ACTN|nr:hypothetical protein [Kribbella kalugense]TDW24126.1 hypothetical protein EV650_2991 [Kribbella kalugense]